MNRRPEGTGIRRNITCNLCVVVLCAGTLLAAPAGVPKADAATYKKSVAPLLAKYCYGCHNASLKSGNLNLQAYQDASAALKEPNVWELVGQKLHAGVMPPPGLPKPKAEDVHTVSRWIQALLEQEDKRNPDPGRVTAHRLNRFEYNNTIHDLLELNFRAADDFPADDSGYGFDNIGDVLSLSPVLMEKYLAAAEGIARMAIMAGAPPKPSLRRYKTEAPANQVLHTFETKHRFPITAEYELRASLQGRRPVGEQRVHVAFYVDDKQVKIVEHSFSQNRARLFDTRVSLPPGDHMVRAEILDDTAREDPRPGAPKGNGIEYLEVRGPYASEPPQAPPSHKVIFVCGHAGGEHTDACLRTNIAELARRAWRRPVTTAETARLVSFAEMARHDGDSYEKAMRVALEAILVSPHFLFRIESDPHPAALTPHPISDFELASRLSYFLWSSMPDEELFRAAAGNRLRKPEVLAAHVKRMLADPKSERLVNNFAGQWLELRNLDSVKPDPKAFPGFDDELRAAMRRETELFFDSIVRDDRSILDFIDARYTFLNERLAKHYGIEGVTGNEFRRVDLDGSQRSGILTQASILTVTSYPNRTSPVLRGKFLLENILNAPPPPPPPDAGVLDESQVNLNGTVREQFEQHRNHPQCAGCHVRMDPLGFSFENYDAIGAWRTNEGKFTVDASGKLPDGRKFNGAADLKTILRDSRDDFAQCLSEKMLTYALGRGLEKFDRAAIREISRKVADHEYRFSAMILAIAESSPFQMRRGEAPAAVSVAKQSGGK
jgi:mono/diheme cytochrome c family protein